VTSGHGWGTRTRENSNASYHAHGLGPAVGRTFGGEPRLGGTPRPTWVGSGCGGVGKFARLEPARGGRGLPRGNISFILSVTSVVRTKQTVNTEGAELTEELWDAAKLV